MFIPHRAEKVYLLDEGKDKQNVVITDPQPRSLGQTPKVVSQVCSCSALPLRNRFALFRTKGSFRSPLSRLPSSFYRDGLFQIEIE